MMNLTICIPTYKRLDYLKKYVETVPEKYPVCISDNGNFIPDNFFLRKNITIKHLQDVVPMFDNWNSAMKLAHTDWIVLPGDDDIVIVDKLDYIEEKIKKYNQCGLILFGHSIIDENEKETEGWCPNSEHIDVFPLSFQNLSRTLNCRWPSIVINMKFVKKAGFFDTDFTFTASDSLFLQKMAIVAPVAYIPTVVGQYRIWSNSFTNIKIFTLEWFEQLRLWQDKLSDFLVEHHVDVDKKRMSSLVLFDNLNYALLVSKYNHSLYERICFLKKVGIPFHAGVVNILRLFKSLI